MVRHAIRDKERKGAASMPGFRGLNYCHVERSGILQLRRKNADPSLRSG